MLIRRETAADVDAIRDVHRSAFANSEGTEPVEAGLVDALRADVGWLPELSLVALDPGDQTVCGHVVCTRGTVAGRPALGLGPLGVVERGQSQGVGSALMHAVLGAADALGEQLVVLLGHTGYYPRFGFVPASGLGITAPDPSWGDHFQARPLSSYDSGLRGEFGYAKPFTEL
ncbi:GCN5 family acetyltransferase [Prauserella marina]|uniref:Putative acetyltransferase n=1 Tax=Prauserella marina TaxID=530584 RepID=A0A222VIL2_9PSEU|nr:N-acetyltransferase [Prauserella marina]ASR33759.1 GCN5 family acetyltransferase [Prauserella marina]PWV82333.1 putative acetyltransferase [Prauserella marina]SDC66642.1 putative acetyltransferase [Prauserella marina]